MWSPSTARARRSPRTSWACYTRINEFRWAAEVNVVSVDSYPDPADAEAHLLSAMAGDLSRSVGGAAGPGC